MSSEKTYDAVVVGGGPAGSTAAHAMGRRGRDVLLVDKAEFPRDKLCGGLLTWKTKKLLEREFGLSVDELREQGAIDFSTGEYTVRFDTDVVKTERSPEPYHFANRRKYDATLFRKAASHDTVTTAEGTGVTEINSRTGEVALSTGETVTGEYIIGADGAHSTVRNALESEGWLDKDEWTENLAIGVEAYPDRDEVALSTDKLVVDLGFINWGYGWVFPNTDRYIIGIGGLNRKNDGSFREALNDYFEYLGVDQSGRDIKGYPIPFGNYITDPTAGRVLLVGDAAGMVDAMSGEGIFYGQRSGELCGEAVHRAVGSRQHAATRYRDSLQEYVIPELRLSRLIRPLLWGGPSTLRRPIIHTWGAALHNQWEELVHGTRLYQLLQRKGDQFHTLIP